MEEIHSGAMSRAALDDKTGGGRFQLWNDLAERYFNNRDWDASVLALANEYVDDIKVAMICPNPAPNPAISGQTLRDYWCVFMLLLFSARGTYVSYAFLTLAYSLFTAGQS
jgi:hypothetical protein